MEMASLYQYIFEHTVFVLPWFALYTIVLDNKLNTYQNDIRPTKTILRQVEHLPKRYRTIFQRGGLFLLAITCVWRLH